ncbi:MAG: 3-deoxy-7-phosphoheptulonate synthase [Gammaproteobacteria bacterium]
MHSTTEDLRIKSINNVITPEVLHDECPITDRAAETVSRSRAEIHRLLHGEDNRLLVVVGPCSIHDPVAAMDYARHIQQAREQWADQLLIVMRVYFEKPRTTVGWKGLINDPNLDDSFEINKGLRLARQLLIVGFKNGTDGTLKVAIDAIRAAMRPHCFLSMTKAGLSAIFNTAGNEDCHLILRGGKEPNYDAKSVKIATDALLDAKVNPRLMIDFSHANSQKVYQRQIGVGEDVAQQIVAGNDYIMGAMIESHLIEGRQNVENGKDLTYGQSITDACISWDQTVPLLEMLASAVQQRQSR